MKLEEIELRNILIHKNFKCEFCPTINVIIGGNDKGKTTILRSIKILSENRPSNPEKKYLTTGAKAKDQLIRLTTTDNEIIRSNKKIILNDRNNNLLFETKGALGTSVPEPIKQALNLKPVNWQWSKAPYFLLLDNGGNAAKYFEKVTGSDDFELLMNTLKSEISITKSTVKELEKKKEQQESDLKKLDEIDLNYIQKIVRNCINITDKIKENKEIILNISKHISTLEKCKKSISLKEILTIKDKIDKAITTISKINDNEKTIDDIDSKINILNNKPRDIDLINKMIIKLKKVFLITEHISKNESDLIDIKNHIERLQATHWTLNSKIEILKIENQIKEKLKELKICPLCHKKTI